MTLRDRRERSFRQYFTALIRLLGSDYYRSHGQGD